MKIRLTEGELVRLIKRIINEEFLDEPKFYRFTINEMVGIEDGIYKPKPRKLRGEGITWTFSLFNAFNFPLQSRSINLMDEIAKNNLSDNSLGSNQYEIMLDDSSNLGWSFFVMMGIWEHATGPLLVKNHPEFEFPKGLMNNEDFLNFNRYVAYNDNTMMNRYIQTLIDYGVIGRGKISELLSSPFWGKVPCYVWTEDKVKINKI